MKRTDAFMLAVTAFVFANCISYFVRSGTPFVTGWGRPPGVDGWYEEVGFPFVLYERSLGGIVPRCRRPWINWVGNLAVAITISYFSAIYLANRLPPLWPGQSRAFRYSLRELLGSIAVFSVLLGTAMTSRPWGLLVRNIVCLAGPVCVCAWFWHRRQASWVHIAVAGVGLTLLTLALDFRYQEPPIDRHAIVEAMLPAAEPKWSSDWAHWEDYWRRTSTRDLIVLTLVRAMVPVFGLLSLLVIGSATHSVVRQYYAVRASRNADL